MALMTRISLVVLLLAPSNTFAYDVLLQFVVDTTKVTKPQVTAMKNMGKGSDDRFYGTKLLGTPTAKYKWLEVVPKDAQEEALIVIYESNGALLLYQRGVRTETDIVWTQVNKLPADFMPVFVP